MFLLRPNPNAQQPAHAGGALKHEEPSVAWPVRWSGWLDVEHLDSSFLQGFEENAADASDSLHTTSEDGC